MAFKELKNEAGVSLGYLQTDAQERLGIHNLLHVQDQKAAGVDGGDFTSGAYRTRDFNTVVMNNIAGASLDSNQITLPVGTYFVSGGAPAYKTQNHGSRLYNVTNSTVLIVGLIERTDTTDASNTRSNVSGVFTLTAESVIEFQHLCRTTSNSAGLGSGYDFGQEYNIFSDLKIWKVA